MNNIDALIREGLEIKTRMDADKIRLASINATLADLAEYKEGSQTGHIYLGNYHVKVTRKTNVKWDQTELNRVRDEMGDYLFCEIFTWEFKPKSKKTLDGFMQYGDKMMVAMVNLARKETAGAPYVEYEILEDA